MKIVIFENEFESVEIAFKFTNKKYYSNTLEFHNHPRSDSVSDITSLESYDLIIVDLDLSSKSSLDGFGLIRLIETQLMRIPPILILTGQSLSPSYDKENSLAHKYPVLEKPINFKILFEKFKDLGITPVP